jgi:uncharacterized protein DUF6804
MALFATIALAASVLFRSSADYRMLISIVVSVAALLLVVRSLSKGKVVWSVLFLVALGVFTPFRISHFSPELISIFDLATLALFAASPMMLRKPAVVVGVPSGRQ